MSLQYGNTEGSAFATTTSAKALPEHWIEARASRAVDPVTGAIQAYVITLDMWLEFKAALAHERRIRDGAQKGDGQ